MCYNGKCLHCIPVEHGSLAFAIISVIGNALALVWSIVQAIIWNIRWSNRDMSNVEGDHEGTTTIFRAFRDGMEMLAVETFLVVVAVGSLIALIFSVLLCVGIRNCRPGKVLAYFVYGAVVVVLSTSGCLLYLCESSNVYRETQLGVIGLSACAIYSLCLVMVYKTYAKLQKKAMFKNHVPLVENYKSGP